MAGAGFDHFDAAVRGHGRFVVPVAFIVTSQNLHIKIIPGFVTWPGRRRLKRVTGRAEGGYRFTRRHMRAQQIDHRLRWSPPPHTQNNQVRVANRLISTEIRVPITR